MTLDEQLDAAAEGFIAEMAEWKVVEHGFYTFHALRSDGTLVAATDIDAARLAVRRAAAAKLFEYYKNILASEGPSA